MKLSDAVSVLFPPDMLQYNTLFYSDGIEMKIEREYPSFIITKKGSAWVGTGHPWIYAQEIISKSTEPENGALVDALSENGRYLGTGLYSRESKIGLRLISRNANDRFDAEFWKRRIRYAWDYRRTVMGFPLLVEVLRESGERIDGIYERNDVAIRALEGLEQGKGWYELPGEEHPQSTVTEICENGIYYAVDFENGQKTGFFLDQKYNRFAVARLAKGRRVLDCFTHTGSFALNAARGGAEHVTAVDVSESAVEMARENARRNGLEDRMDFVAADVFDLLPEVKKGEYDFIILDPPAFTKSRKTVGRAEKGYKEINLRALKALPRGGYFATASCSHFMPSELFVKMLRSAAQDANVELRQIEARQQAPDHPILWNVPETDYLKFYIFQVV